MDNETRARLEGIEAAIDELRSDLTAYSAIKAAIVELRADLTANFAADKEVLDKVDARSRRTAINVDKQTIVLFALVALIGFLIVQGKLSGQGVDTTLLDILVPVVISILAGSSFLPKKG